MSETLNITSSGRQERYRELLPQLKSLVEQEKDAIANIANVCAALSQAMGFFWVGCYRVYGNELLLGPFRGDIACTRIRHGKGVCGSAWAQQTTLIIPDVDAFPGHIACSSQSRSEVVVPVFYEGKVVGVLDVDSDKLNDFSLSVDGYWLAEVARLIAPFVKDIALL
ncbi:Free methionine-R-sulfoxide reductase [Porphyromonas macacae]|uniref:Free methionine-R-sulfoxide reductase n=1 Tax=Porphyromonas macacae TaxID=28115 RepID=A0A379E717_9PORP|nr:GAF domain-containing protein [Porphyromonas macacae]SUB88485.1 Free methionine-R-sulfoxide reductase [Porphyromonas macacae]